MTVRRMGSLPQVDVRFDPADRALVGRLTAMAGVAPPLAANTVASAPDGQGHWLWLGPDEWLVVGPEGGVTDAEVELALMCMQSDFAQGNLAAGVVRGVDQLAAHAHRA